MAIMVVYTAEGIDAARFAPYEAEIQKTVFPSEALIHQVGMDGDSFACVDIWTSRDALEAWTERFIKPNLKKHGITYAEPRIYELSALVTHDAIDAFKARKAKSLQDA